MKNSFLKTVCRVLIASGFLLLIYPKPLECSESLLVRPGENSSLMDWAEYGNSKIGHGDIQALMWLMGGLRLHKMGNFEKAQSYLDRSVETLRGKISSIGTTWPILEKVVKGYIETNQYEKARTLTAKILEPSHHAAARLALMDMELKRLQQRDLSLIEKLRTVTSMEAKQMVMQEMLNFNPTQEIGQIITGIRDQKTRILAYAKGVNHMVESGSKKSAEGLLTELLDKESQTENKSHRGLVQVLYSNLLTRIHGKPEKKLKETGYQLIRNVKDPVSRVRFGLEALRSGDIGREQAIRELDRLAEDAYTIAYKDIRAQVLGEISEQYAKFDDETRAFKMVAHIWEMLKKTQEVILHDLIIMQTTDILLNLDRFKDTHEWADAVKNPNRRAHAWMEVLPYHAQSGDMAFAVKKATELNHPIFSLAATIACVYSSDESLPEEMHAELIKVISTWSDNQIQ